MVYYTLGTKKRDSNNWSFNKAPCTYAAQDAISLWAASSRLSLALNMVRRATTWAGSAK